jgi:hypothetical protein
VRTGVEGHIDADPVVRDRLGSTVRMPGNFDTARRQLDPHADLSKGAA